MNTDYTPIDPTFLGLWLYNMDPQMSVYTYKMLSNGVDRRSIMLLDEDALKGSCGVQNPLHRLKILRSIGAKPTQPKAQFSIFDYD